MLQEDSVVGIWCFFSYMVRIGLYQTLYIVRFLPVGGQKNPHVQKQPTFLGLPWHFCWFPEKFTSELNKKIIRKKSVGHENDHYPWRVVVSCPAGGLGGSAQPMTTQPVETVDFLLSKAARLDKARLWWQFPTLCGVFLRFLLSLSFLKTRFVTQKCISSIHICVYLYRLGSYLPNDEGGWIQLLDINLHVTHQSYTNLSPKYQDFYHWCDMFCSNTGDTTVK